MKLGSFTPSGSNQTIWTRSKPNIPSDMVIAKPPTLGDTCPMESQSKRFPVIKEAHRKKKPSKKSVSSSDSLGFWLKPGISLPKLHSKAAPQEKEEAGERFTGFRYSDLSRRKTESDLDETPSADDVKCIQKKSEEFQIPSSVVGPSQCQVLFKVPSSELNLDKLKAEEEVIEEDHALKQWRIWTQRHKKQQNYLSKRLGRKPYDLLSQKTDLYRQTLENKILLGTYNVPQADKWRGHPYRWAAPVEVGIAKDGDYKSQDRDSAPVYFLQKTLVQKGIVTDLEFIGIPAVVQKEKGLEYSRGIRHEFLKENQRIDDAAVLAEERIQSFLKLRHRMRPPSENFKQMAVVGNTIRTTPQEVTPDPPVIAEVPLITVTGPDNETSYQDTRQSIFCLVINGREIKYRLDQSVSQNKKDECGDFTWELDFGVNELRKRVEKALEIENRGTMAVRYKWISKKLEGRQKLNKLVPKEHEPWFFFNKNSGVFLPGQHYNLKFYYHAQKSGALTETWFIKTFPPLDRNAACGRIILSAVASGDCQNLKLQVLQEYLRQRLRESIMKFILDIIIEKATSCSEGLQELEYQSLFFEKELFEYHNSRYYYHSEVVEELSGLFKKIPSKIQKNWDLSLDSLKTLISISTKGKDRDYLLRELYDTAKLLLKPNHVFCRRERKYRMAYDILCKMTNFMEVDADSLKNILSNKSRKAQGRNAWQFYEFEETDNSLSLTSEEKCDLDSGSTGSIYEMKPVNLIYFQTMFYIRVYHRVSEAVEDIVGVLETSKRFESSGEVGCGFSRLSRPDKEFDFAQACKLFSK